MPSRRECLAGVVGASLFAFRGQAQATDHVRIVSLEITLTETMLALGSVPIANANNPLYTRLVGWPTLPNTVEDVGTSQEPNLEAIRLLQADVLLISEWQAPIASILSAVAPVRLVRTVRPGIPPLDIVRAMTREVAGIVGLDAGPVEKALETSLAKARETLPSGQSVVVCRFAEDGRNLAIFGTRSMVGGLVEVAGLRNAWTGRQNAVGTTLLAIEDLAAMPDAVLIHFDRGAETRRALSRLASNPLWSVLPFASDGRVHALPVIHPNGGILSATRFAAALAELQFGQSSHG